MSLLRPILNFYLRLTEKRHLARARTPADLRRAFEIKAKLFFHPPRGTVYRPDDSLGVPAIWVTPKVTTGTGVILYLHGGGYVFGSPDTHKAMLAWLAAETGWRACLPDYGKAPEHPFPAAIDDALAVYRALLAQGHGRIVLGGDSAGGGLALALLGEICRLGMPQPVGCFAFSPLTDMTYAGASVVANAKADVVLPVSRIDEMNGMVLAGADPRDSRISPFYASFTGAGPVWMTAGTTEILLDDTRRMAVALRAAGVQVTEVIVPDLPHVWPIFHNLLPEARQTLRAVAVWMAGLKAPEQS